MPLLGGRRSPVRRFGLPLLTGGLLAIIVLFVVARVGDQAAHTPEAVPDDATAESAAETGGGASAVVTVYSSPTCGCCHEYERYLEEEGFNVKPIETEELDEMKDGLGVPPDMRSCHTAMIEEYFIEGHVPVEAIRKLLDERPLIDGIALPGMPSGSPGMGGDKEQPFTIYSIAEGRAEEFMTL